MPPQDVGEVLPVPTEMIRLVWKKVRYIFEQIPGYQIERTHSRLLAGIDRLWLGVVKGEIRGVIVTSVSIRPPSKRKVFQRVNPTLMRSLTIHLVGGSKRDFTPRPMLLSWLPSAIARLSAYARENDCHQLFLMARKGWQKYVKHFWSREWEAVALSRDRPTKSRCPRFRGRNTPGYWRLMVPVPAEKYTRHMQGFMGTFYFKEAA